MNRCRWMLTGLLLLLSGSVAGQVQVNDYDLLHFRLRVKQVSEFMSRFNQDELPPNLKVGDTLLHEKAFIMLFDYNLIERRQDDVWRLVQRLVADERRLSFTDTTWYAKATCNVTLGTKKSTLTLVLRTEHVKGYRYKWVLVDASGDALSLTPLKSNPGLRIDPTDNELNFMSLHTITKNEWPNILNYKAAGRELDGLSVFLALVQADKLKINHVEELVYYFNGPSYRLVVNNFRRDDLNSGWLISDFTIE